MKKTTSRRFVGQNIKGTPAMKAQAVQHDLRVVKSRSDVAVLEEFKWPWYWTTARRVLAVALPKSKAWGAFPGFTKGLARPTDGAQAVTWKRSLYKRVGKRERVLHQGAAGISETRWIRAALLEDRATGLRAWHGVTHFVVGGDRKGSGPKRRQIMAQDLRVLDAFLGDLAKTGYPVIFQMDGNVHKDSERFDDLLAILKRHGAKTHGERGIEYLWTMDGRHGSIVVEDDWTIPTKDLRTDHEGRGITYRIKGT